jgi:hypothetical protein
MSTDGQGRPLSDDGQWAWNGTEWVPAAIGGAVPVPQAWAEPEPEPESFDPNATVITRSPFAREAAPDEVSQPGFPATPLVAQPYDPTQGYGVAPQPAKGGRSFFTPRIIAIAAVVILVAAAIVLIVTLTGSKTKEAAGPLGIYVCTVPGSTDTGSVTFESGGHYALSNGKSGTYTQSADKLTFKAGDLDQATGLYTSDNQTVKITYKTVTLTCKAK